MDDQQRREELTKAIERVFPNKNFLNLEEFNEKIPYGMSEADIAIKKSENTKVK